MYETFNLEKASNLIKNIVDNIQCNSCDKLQETIVRYTCGHFSCEDCAKTGNGCVKCSSQETENRYSIDPVSTKVAKCTQDVLNTFQKAFDIDVMNRQRICNKLKVERDVFPDCIQAQRKYYNKTKSITPNKTKNHSFIIPGEAVTSKSMNKKMVKKWLESTDKPKRKRSALSDIDVNSPQKINRTSFFDNDRTALQNKLKFSDDYKKMSPINIQYDSAIFSDEEDFIEEISSPKLKTQTKLSKANKDLNEPIVIDDTESTYIDKDEAALQAVIQADKATSINNSATSDFIDTTKPDTPETSKVNCTVLKEQKVPFITNKNSPTCHSKEINAQDVPFSLTLELNDYIIRIEEKEHEIDKKKMQSKSVQTDQSISCDTNRSPLERVANENCIKSHNANGKQNLTYGYVSDSDDLDSVSDTNESNQIKVIADVHECSQNVSPSVLREVSNVIPRQRTKRFIASSDSSEKENKDPNTRRGRTTQKKKTYKKSHKSYN